MVWVFQWTHFGDRGNTTKHPKPSHNQKKNRLSAHTADHSTIPWGRDTEQQLSRHKEVKQSEATISLFPINMISKPERVDIDIDIEDLFCIEYI